MIVLTCFTGTIGRFSDLKNHHALIKKEIEFTKTMAFASITALYDALTMTMLTTRILA